MRGGCLDHSGRCSLSSTDQLGQCPRWQPDSVLGPASNPLPTCCPAHQCITGRETRPSFTLHHPEEGSRVVEKVWTVRGASGMPVFIHHRRRGDRPAGEERWSGGGGRSSQRTHHESGIQSSPRSVLFHPSLPSFPALLESKKSI